MHPLFSDARHVFWYAAACLMTGAAVAVSLAASENLPIVSTLSFTFPVCLVYGFVAMSAYYVCRALPLTRRRLPRLLATYGMTSIIGGLLLLAICTFWLRAGQAMGSNWGFVVIGPRTPYLIFGIGAAFYLFVIMALDVFIALDNLRNAERRANESRVLAREAELQLLRTQINPHFLFNSLNSISALTSIDAAAARNMTISLAQFFRQTLALAEREKITLAEEMALCDSFLAVEKIRFGKKLDARMQIADDAKQALIPPMILQPLLENAIKHGIRTLAEGGIIALEIVLRDAWLYITVSNPMDPDASAPQGNGIGLENIRRRCATLYDGRARVEWKSAMNESGAGCFVVSLTLPYQLEP